MQISSTVYKLKQSKNIFKQICLIYKYFNAKGQQEAFSGGTVVEYGLVFLQKTMV